MSLSQISTASPSNRTDEGEDDSFFSFSSYSAFETIVITLVAAILSLMTIIGNVMVMVSFKMDKQLQTISNYFLLSLALADFLIGLISMPLYTMYLLLDRWPLGPLVCDTWLAFDYLNSNASVLNLLVISFDRYFSVTRPLTYRIRRTTRKVCLMIASTWLLSLALWPPWIFAWPYIEGKRTVPHEHCYIQFLETNIYITFGTALAAFYIPVSVMCFLYWRIWRETEKRYKDLTTLFLVTTFGKKVVEPKEPRKWFGWRSRKGKGVEKGGGGSEGGGGERVEEELHVQSTSGTASTTMTTTTSGQPIKASESIYTILIQLDSQSNSSIKMIESQDQGPGTCVSHASHNEVTSAPPPSTASQTKPKTTTTSTTARLQPKSERKAAKTLSAILLAFIITWTPYNVLVLIKTLSGSEGADGEDDMISETLWNFSYYLCYINSTINPFCYALCNINFRQTYLRILKCNFTSRPTQQQLQQQAMQQQLQYQQQQQQKMIKSLLD